MEGIIAAHVSGSIMITETVCFSLCWQRVGNFLEDINLAFVMSFYNPVARNRAFLYYRKKEQPYP